MGEAKRAKLALKNKIIQIVKDFKANVEWIADIEGGTVHFLPVISMQYVKEGKTINGDAIAYIEWHEPELYKLINEDFTKLECLIHEARDKAASQPVKVTDPVDLDKLKHKYPEAFANHP